MTDLYNELLKATDNLVDITFSRFGTITIIDNGLCTVKEEEQDIIHQNVPILNKVAAKVGDKVVLGFVDNSLYNPIVLGNLTRGNENVEVDSELSVTSINPVQNKVISAALNDKANSSHTHTIANVTNLQTSLDNKANVSHNHNISDVTDLQSSLDGKASSSHTHTKSEITDFAHNHGQITNTGAMGREAVVTVANNDNILISDASDSNLIKKVATIRAIHLKDANAYSVLGTVAYDTQSTINQAIDTKMGSLEDTIPSKTSDLTNDGDDGSNVFVKDNDSRLSDNRNPSSHNLAPTSTHLINLDNVRGTGFYYAFGNTNIQYVSNLPSDWGNTSFYLTVEETNSTTYCKQTITSYGGDKMFVRTRWGSGWSNWRQIQLI